MRTTREPSSNCDDGSLVLSQNSNNPNTCIRIRVVWCARARSERRLHSMFCHELEKWLEEIVVHAPCELFRLPDRCELAHVQRVHDADGLVDHRILPCEAVDVPRLGAADRTRIIVRCIATCDARRILDQKLRKSAGLVLVGHVTLCRHRIGAREINHRQLRPSTPILDVERTTAHQWIEHALELRGVDAEHACDLQYLARRKRQLLREFSIIVIELVLWSIHRIHLTVTWIENTQHPYVT